MGFFGKLVSGATKWLSKSGAGGSLLSAVMPWGKAIGFIGGAAMTYDSIKKDQAELKKTREYAGIGQGDTIEGAKYAAEDYRINKGMLNQKYDLRQEQYANQLDARESQVDQAAGSTQLQLGEVNKMKDQVQDAYSYQTDANQLAYDSGAMSLTRNLRKDLEGYQKTYTGLSQYTNDRSMNFMEAYKGLLS